MSYKTDLNICLIFQNKERMSEAGTEDIVTVKDNNNNNDNNNNQQQPSIENKSQTNFVEYKYRWFIVLLMTFAFIINGLANNAIIPIKEKIGDTYQLSDVYVYAPVNVSFLVYSIMNFPANHLIDTKGLRFSLLIGTLLYGIGLGFFSMINSGYHWVLFGAILVALGQPFVINCPAKVATFWFKSENRPFATALMTGLNIVATGIGIVLPAVFVKEDSQDQKAKNQVGKLYSDYFILALICFALHFFFMRAQPPTAPSKGAAEEKTSVLQSFKIIKDDKNLKRFFGAYIILYGTLLSFGALSNSLFKPYGYKDIQIAMLGVCLIVFGVIGSILFSLYLKKTRNYSNAVKKITRFSLLVMVITIFWLNFVGKLGGTIFLTMCLGFIFTPLVPVSYDLGCQLAFPIGQAQVIGILNGGAMMLTFVLNLILNGVIGSGTKEQSRAIFFIFVVFLAIGTYIYGKVDIILKRSEFESQNNPGGEHGHNGKGSQQPEEILSEVGEEKENYKNLNEENEK